MKDKVVDFLLHWSGAIRYPDIPEPEEERLDIFTCTCGCQSYFITPSNYICCGCDNTYTYEQVHGPTGY